MAFSEGLARQCPLSLTSFGLNNLRGVSYVMSIHQERLEPGSTLGF